MDTEPETAPPYRKLILWQKTIELAKMVYQLTRSMPKEEQFGLISQMRRAAVSIPSNIAEGHHVVAIRNSPAIFRYRLVPSRNWIPILSWRMSWVTSPTKRTRKFKRK